MAITDLVPWRRGEKDVPAEREETRSLQTLRRDLDSLFDEFLGRFDLGRAFGDSWTTFSPRVDVSESDNAIKVSAELPGMDDKDVNVSFSRNVLTISGEKKEESEREDEDRYYVERSYGSFRRSISLPDVVDADNIEAVFKNGVLTVTLPKSEKAQATKIDVKTG